MRRLAILGYGLVVYAYFLWTILRAIAFVGGYGFVRGIDEAPVAGGWRGWLVDLGLLGLFALQHMIMARRGFKRRLARVLPESVERSTFVLATCLVLDLLFASWRALPGEVWRVENELLARLLVGLSLSGWALVFVTTFLIDHFELFGLRQVWRAWRRLEPAPKRFLTPSLYRWSRHPMYLGFFVAFWATPVMSPGHLLFALLTGAFVIFEVLVFEERGLVADFGDQYRDYQRRVPMFLPLPRSRRSERTIESKPV